MSNFFQGGGFQLLIPIEKKTCDFPGEVRTPCPPPLDPHLGLSMVLSIHAVNASNLTNRYLGMFLEGRTRNQSISGQALYHDCAPQLGSILCRYDTCPTQYAPDLRGSILCMQGTQYAPRESILCMEHFVALQSRDRMQTAFLF